VKPFWNNEKLIKLEMLKGSHTNNELAEYFETTRRHIIYSMNHFGIKRTNEESRYVQTKRDQKGEKNGNYKGGIAKNNYHYKKLQKERYPERIRARAKVNRAIRSGRLVKENCKFCETDQNIQAHISDYKNPLESVVWCCRRCNIIHHHRKNPESTFFSNHEIYTDRELELIKEIKRIFPSSSMIVWYATAEQIKQLKNAGLSGISRKQRKPDSC